METEENNFILLKGEIFMSYEKPVVVEVKELAEGVYAASGEVVYTTCQSKYLKGNYQVPTGSSTGRYYMGDTVTGSVLGCQTCKHDRNYACHVAEDRPTKPPMPVWEAEGHTWDEPFTYKW